MLKKIIKSSFLMLFLLLIILILACKSDLANSTVEGFFDSVKSGDTEKASEYLFHDINSYSFINSVFTFENEQQRELALKTFSKMNYRIKSTSKVDDTTYKVTIEIEHVDFVKLTEDIMPEIVEQTDAASDQSKDELNNMISLVNTTFINKLSDTKVPMMKSKVEIDLFLDTALTKISIIPNEELLNSISGNLVEAYELMVDENALAEVIEE